MIDAWTAAQVREAERPHLEAGEPLMQRAADGLGTVVREVLRASSVRRGGRTPKVLLLVGSGNNGADALYAGESLARELVPAGGAVTVVPAGARVHEEALAAALEAGAVLDDVEGWCDEAAVSESLPGYDVVLDGLVGTGSHGPGLRGEALRVVQAMLGVGVGVGVGVGAGAGAGAWAGAAGAPPVVVAVDVPSGIGVDDGTVPDPLAVLAADVTVTFGGHKVGLLVAPASRLAGRLVLVDIGIGVDLARLPPAFSTP
jgi:NAD(P)H-hydrate repair Nnr-like enzyme with NAD(P)H-hydrate epimerase domain